MKMRSLFAACCLMAFPAVAELKLPPPSPSAMVKQQVGLTDVTVEYSSPGVKGRKVWGEVVPFDKPWRTGANAPTKITFSRDVTFGGKSVPAGTYSLATLPTAKGWTVVLNKDVGPWENKLYDAKTEVARVTATASAIPVRERLAFLFTNTTDTDTSLDLEWEALRVSVPIKIDTAKMMAASIKEAVEESWQTHAQVARYYGNAGNDLEAALKYADTSLGIESNWYNNWVKAELLAKKGNFAEARKLAQTAWDLGKKDEKSFFAKTQVAKALEEWKNKS